MKIKEKKWNLRIQLKYSIELHASVSAPDNNLVQMMDINWIIEWIIKKMMENT